MKSFVEVKQAPVLILNDMSTITEVVEEEYLVDGGLDGILSGVFLDIYFEDGTKISYDLMDGEYKVTEDLIYNIRFRAGDVLQFLLVNKGIFEELNKGDFEAVLDEYLFVDKEYRSHE